MYILKFCDKHQSVKINIIYLLLITISIWPNYTTFSYVHVYIPNSETENNGRLSRSVVKHKTAY